MGFEMGDLILAASVVISGIVLIVSIRTQRETKKLYPKNRENSDG